MLLTMDPPEHTKLRRLVSRAFTPRRIAGARSTDARDRVALPRRASIRRPTPTSSATTRGSCRSTSSPSCSAFPMPTTPACASGATRSCTARRASPTSPPPVSKRAGELYEYFCAFVTDKRARPGGDDLTAALLAAESDGEHLDDLQVVGFLFLLIIAGNETTTKLLGNCLLALQRNPAPRAEVLANPARIPDAVEEILRYEGSTQVMARTLTRDTERHGVRDARGREGAPAARLRESRRPGVGARRRVRHRSRVAHAPRRVRSRHSRVSRCAPGPPRDAHRSRGVPRPDFPTTRSTNRAWSASTPAMCADTRACPSAFTRQ